MSALLYRTGRWCARRPLVAIGSWVVLFIVVLSASAGIGRTLKESFDVPGLDSQKASDLQRQAQSHTAGVTAQVVLSPKSSTTTFAGSTADREAVRAMETRLRQLPRVLALNTAISPDSRVAIIRVQYPVVEKLSAADLRNLKRAAQQERAETPLTVEAGGELFFTFEDDGTSAGEVIGLVAAVIILLLAFGSVIAMGLPIGVALFGLAISISSLSLITYVIEIPSWAPVVGAMVGLGVGIDYALFLVTRHREFLARGLTVEESVGRAMATAGQAILFAGGTVVIAILGLAFAGIPFLTEAGVAIATIVLVMVLASLTLLPAALGLVGHRINRRGRRHLTSSGPSARWAHWARHVSLHPWPYAVGSLLVLVALALPAVTMRLGFPDQGSLPQSRTERQAYDLVAGGFGAGTNGPLLIAIDTSADRSVVGPIATAVAADNGIAAVAPATVNANGTVATLLAFPTTAPQDRATLDTITRLRTHVLPAALGHSRATAHVGGQTATWADLGHRVGTRLPLFIAAVVLLSFLLLTVVFRSVLVPLKAAAMNLLSIAAAYGVTVMVFQWGWGKNLIGLQETVPIIAFIPMFMFAILFGLSMDYEVFLLSRVREEYTRTNDSTASVVQGIASTARVITCAALIMICVFLGFVLGSDPATKMMGLGLATAILIDATLVRLVLVPATMTLLGSWNWWLPAWLDRLLPVVDSAGEAGLPARQLERVAVPS